MCSNNFSIVQFFILNNNKKQKYLHFKFNFSFVFFFKWYLQKTKEIINGFFTGCGLEIGKTFVVAVNLTADSLFCVGVFCHFTMNRLKPGERHQIMQNIIDLFRETIFNASYRVMNHWTDLHGHEISHQWVTYVRKWEVADQRQ